MDSTARMVSLLAGWAGQGTAIETTQGIIARHIGKSVRQVQRMLLDAWREGYLNLFLHQGQNRANYRHKGFPKISAHLKTKNR